MSEVIAKAGKIAYYAVITALIIAFFVGVVTTISAMVSESSFANLGLEVTNALVTGRRLVNNFIPATAFNAAIGLWFTGTAVLIADYLVVIIGGKIAGTR